MTKFLLFVAAGFIISFLIAAAANAATINCPSSGVCNGTTAPDTMYLTCGTTSAFGLQGADTIVGTSCAENIYGGDGGDNINAYQGPDLVNGQGGNDTVRGGDGQDQLYGSFGIDHMYGGPSNDVLADSICIGSDNWSDRFYGEGGSDTAYYDINYDLLFTVEVLHTCAQ